MKNPLTLAALIVLAADLFNQNKDENTVYATEDGQLFFDENRAKLHTKSFEEKVKIHTITRTEALGNDVNEGTDDLSDETIAAKTKELQELELVTANYQKMKTLVNFFNIETVDMKAQTLIDALTEYKSKIAK